MLHKLLPLLLLSPWGLSAQVIHEVTPLELGINTEDYSPIPIDGGFVMSSVREATGMVDMKDARTGKPLADLYFVPLTNGVTGSPVLYSAQLTTMVNEGPAAFTGNGLEICYTRNLVVPKKLTNHRATNGQLGLFFSEHIGDIWQEPVAFEHNSPKHALMHPTFSPDGNTLYFTSDMAGGQGGLDLYSSQRMAGGWSEPENLGPVVNGPENEAFPRMQHNGVLYFSSDRTGGLGKLDIYETRSQDGAWAAPLALPAPINSPANDVGYTLQADGHNAIMSSDRTGVDRILLVHRTIEKFRDCVEQRKDNFCFAFKGRKHAATDNLPLEHVWDMGDGTLVKGISVTHCYDQPGVYEVRSLLLDKKSGSTFYVISTRELEVERIAQAFVAAPDTVRTGRQLALDPSLSHLPAISIAEHNWDLGDGNTKRSPRVIHQYRTAGTYEVKLDILSVPDADGNITSHCSTKKIIVIDKYREHEDGSVVAVYQDAFGDTHSFEYHELPFDDLSMSFAENADVLFSVTLFASEERVSLEDPRFMEIRKHYQVVERFDPVRNVYTYSVGETKDLEELYAIFQKVKELEFLDAEVFALEVETLIDMSQLDLTSLEELNHAKLRTSSIHFEFNSASLMHGSEDVLVQVLDLLRHHPQLHLVIEAHTDDIGTEKANLDLSQQRAASVVEYLKGHGVVSNRLIAIGHGENQPIASNKNEAGRSQNRRVEFRMVVKDDIGAVGRN